MQEAPKTEAPKTEVSEMQPFDGIEKPVQQKEATQKEATQKEGFFQKTKNFFNGLKEANDKGYAPDKKQEQAGTLGKIAGAFVGKGTVEDWNNGRKLTAVGKAFSIIASVVLCATLAGLLLTPLGPVGVAVGVIGGMYIGSKGAKKISAIGKNRNERTIKTIDKSIKAALDQFPEKKQELEKKIATAIKPHEEEKDKSKKSSMNFAGVSVALIILAVVFPPAGAIAGIAAAVAGVTSVYKGYKSYNANNKIKSTKENTTNSFIAVNPEIKKAAAEHFANSATDRQFKIGTEKLTQETSLSDVKSSLKETVKQESKTLVSGILKSSSTISAEKFQKRKEVLASKGHGLQ